MTMLVCVETARDADARGAVSMVAGHALLAQGGLHGAGYLAPGRHVREHCVRNHSKENSVAPATKPTNCLIPRLLRDKHVVWPPPTPEP